MSWLPRSPKARRRLWAVALAAPILAVAVGLAVWASRDAVAFFVTPSQATVEAAPAGRNVRLGGLVEAGSVRRMPGGEVRFVVTDGEGRTEVAFAGVLPDLFREGQGVVAEGAFEPDRRFRARQVLAKHDETYMPREVAEALKARGEWRPESGAPPPVGASR